MNLSREVIERFWSKVDKSAGPDGCWIWRAATGHRRRGDISGYGMFGVLDASGQFHIKGAHRVSWELAQGTIPEGLCVLHHCDNPPCVNPDHLWLGTRADNTRDMIWKGRQPADWGKLMNLEQWYTALEDQRKETLGIMDEQYELGLASKMNLEILHALRVLTGFLNANELREARINELGIAVFYPGHEILTPIRQDMMMLRLQKEKEGRIV